MFLEMAAGGSDSTHQTEMQAPQFPPGRASDVAYRVLAISGGRWDCISTTSEALGEVYGAA